MGNWTTVKITGTCDAKDLPSLRKACDPGKDWDNFHPLIVCPSLCGLNDWTGTRIDVIGNLAERDYGAEDVAEACRKLVAVAPSLNLKIHVGGDYEDKKCVATVIVNGGQVHVVAPEVQEVDAISVARMGQNLSAMLRNTA